MAPNCEFIRTNIGVKCLKCGRIVVTKSPRVVANCRSDKPRQSKPPGPGAHLTALLADADRWLSYTRWIPGLTALHLESDDCSSCQTHAAQMDRWGPAECRVRLDEIVDWLQTNAAQRGLAFFRPLAKWLVLQAIRRSEHR